MIVEHALDLVGAIDSARLAFVSFASIGEPLIKMLANILRRSHHLSSRLFALSIPYGNHYCCYCEQRIPFFLPYQGGTKHVPPFIGALHVVGSDVDNFSCPRCLSHDRERHLKLYFEALDLTRTLVQKRVLHFAPEKWFSKYIDAAHPSVYIKADLYPSSPEIQQVDLLAMDFSDETFDIVIANHVLEHVRDDTRALQEIYRVLKPGGLALLQTPYSEVLARTFEDEGIQSTEARLQAYGQGDHVRLYGKDLLNRIEQNGFTSRTTDHNSALPNCNPTYFGVNAREPILLFERSR